MREPLALPHPDSTSSPLLPPQLLGAWAMGLFWVLPITLLIILNAQGYQLIEGNLSPDEKSTAHLFGWAGAINLLLGIGLFGFMLRQEKRTQSPPTNLSSRWGLPAIIIQVVYLWMAVYLASDMIPRSVQAWIYPDSRFLYHQFSLAMLPLFWGLLRLACPYGSSENRPKMLRGSLVTVIATPVVLYLILLVFSAFDLNGPLYHFSSYFFAVLIVLSGVFLLWAVIRSLVLGLFKIDTWSPRKQLIAIGMFALVLPWAGLLLNRTIPFPHDFQAWEVYAVTTVNALFLGFASWLRERRPQLSLGLLCATLPFSLYFFIVFLPFLPLAPLAVIVFALGFLFLTPTALLTIQLVLLNRARRLSGRRGWLIGSLCFLLLPGFFTARGLADRTALNAALDFLYAPAITGKPSTYPGNRLNLRRAIDHHISHKNGIYLPLLSDYYAWIVFDNLTLPDDKIEQLYAAFFEPIDLDSLADRSSRMERSSVRRRQAMPRTAPAPRTVHVSDFNLQTKQLTNQTTLATLRLELTNTGSAPAEFAQQIPLPAGVFIRGFRLQVEDQLVPGRIFEKKTALWVYTMIRDTERRDPGLLYYNSHDEIALRVYPVVKNTPSVVEIDFLIPGSAESPEFPAPFATPNIALQHLFASAATRASQDGRAHTVVSGLHRNPLPPSSPNDFVHLIIDRSENNGFTGDVGASLKVIAQHFPNTPTNRITLANYETLPVSLATPDLNQLPLRGGFLADHVLAQSIRQHRDLDLDANASPVPPARPIFVILGKTQTTLPADLKLTEAWREILPTLEIHTLNASGKLAPLLHSPSPPTPLLRLGSSIRPLHPNHAVRFNSDKPTSLLQYWDPSAENWQPIPAVEQSPIDSPWGTAIALQTRQQDYARKSSPNLNDLSSLVAASRETGVLIAPTSYIVVENAAQWKMLETSEAKKLGQNEALAFRETPTPSAIALFLSFAGWQLFRRRQNRRRPAHLPTVQLHV